jgi:methylmalonyl-CoA/ethylmalonyl-CoA epimerase
MGPIPVGRLNAGQRLWQKFKFLDQEELRQMTRLHHVGFVVASISDEIDGFAKSVDADWDRAIFFDPQQKARVAFLKPFCPNAALIELVEPAGELSPVRQFLQKGGGLHHLCYEVSDLGAHLERMRRTGAVIVRRPSPAVAFGQRRIAWTVTKQRLLMEFLEEKPSLPSTH